MRLSSLAFAVAALLAGPSLRAEVPAVLRPQRLIAEFDFEETDDRGQKLGRGHILPEHWYAIGRSAQTADAGFLRQPLHQELIDRPGFPHYTDVRYDAGHAASGEFSLLLSLDGGNAGAYLEVGAVPVVPGSDCLLSVRVRTEGLDEAAARMKAYFVDARGGRIDESVRRTDRLDTRGEWTTVTLTLPGAYDDAAWLGLELELRQPTASPGDPLGTEQVVVQDVAGSAWFDDIRVWQVPHLELATQSGTNIVRAPEKPRVSVHIRDLLGDQLTTELIAYDLGMNVVDRHRFHLGGIGPDHWTWEPELPELGWYLFELRAYDAPPESAEAEVRGALVARTLGAALWLGEEQPLVESDAKRFLVSAEGASDEGLGMLPELLRRTGFRRTLFSAFSPSTRLSELELRCDQLDAVFAELMPGHREVTMSLSPLPEALTRRGGPESPLALLSREDVPWRDWLSPVLMRFGQRVRRWQVGPGAWEDAFFNPGLVEQLPEAHRRMELLAPRPALLPTWSVFDPPPAEGVNQKDPFLVTVSPAVLPEHIPAYVEAWEERGRPYWLMLREPGADELSHPRRSVDLALRMLAAWEHPPAALVLRRPWAPDARRGPGVLPDPLLGVFANVAPQLSGRRVVGRLPLGEGLECMIFDGEAGGMLAMWNRSAPAEEAGLAMYLGEQPVVHDIWGNRRAAPLEEGKHRLEVTRSPLLVTGIDPELALFRAGFTMEPAFLESSRVPHLRAIKLHNPWEQTVNGTLQLVTPEKWEIQPARQEFAIPAGQTIELPVQIRFPISETAGRKRLRAKFDFVADRRYRIEHPLDLEIGMADLDFDPVLTRQGDSALVTCVVTNRSDRPRGLYVFAQMVGHARQERLVPQLQPGESVIRRFRFENVGDQLDRTGVRTGVRESNGPAILNHVLRP
ncbi:MAG: hypothetical protein ACOCTI_07870 [Phycisphaeraceae bacterium]